MRFCFYSPYLPNSSVGGGEKHLFDMALVVAKQHDVFVAITQLENFDAVEIRQRYESFFGCSLKHLTFISTPLNSPASFLQKLWWTKQFDYLFYWTDGSLFFSLAKKNNLHIQIPFTDAKNGVDRLKLLNWQYKNTNSQFTKRIVERAWNTQVTQVVYPLVDVSAFSSNQKKDNIILHVGRFFRQLHTKRQDALVEMFAILCEQNATVRTDWKLVFIGAIEDAQYVQEVKALAQDLPIEFHHSVSRADLIKWYQRAALYWHATGFEADLERHPEFAEHFGISTAEAMAAGAVPIVFRGGGQLEVIGNELLELSWRTLAEGADTTARLIENVVQREKFQTFAVQNAQQFSSERFEEAVWSMVSK